MIFVVDGRMYAVAAATRLQRMDVLSVLRAIARCRCVTASQGKNAAAT